MLDQVPMRPGTPDDLNDSIWTIGPNKRSGIRHAARHGLGCTFLLMFTSVLGVANAEPSLHHAPACREGQPLAYRALLFGPEQRRRPNAPSLFLIDARWRLLHSDQRPIYKLWRVCARAYASLQSS